MNNPEILAPAGSFETLTAGVRAGADAVYLGAGKFNARRNAENFDENLIEAVRFCHIRGVKVYLTLNTLISDYELSDAMSLVKTACEIGTNGIIVQDLGLISLIKKAAPELPLHASTQMSIHTPGGIKLLSEMGFKRVVLARELSKKEISEIAKKAKEENIELEMFIHGALCMSVSGQCYLSALLGGRSGNRGLCAGPCRLPFAVPGGTGHDLSLKDMSLIEEVGELKDLGISSLKIEGRMKRPEYVAASVRACRNALNGQTTKEELVRLENVFSRSGFTKGYYEGKPGKDMFGIREKQDVINSAEVLKQLHDLYRNERQNVPIDMFLKVSAGEKTALTVSDGENFVTAEGEIPEAAVNLPIDKDYAEKRLNKTGGTPYYINKFGCEIDGGLSVSAASMNLMRRNALEILSEKRGTLKPIEFKETDLHFEDKTPLPQKLFVSVSSESQIPDDLSGIDTLYIPINTPAERVTKLLSENINLAVKIPRGMFGTEEFIKKKLASFYNLGVKTALAGNLGAVYTAKESGFIIHGGFSLNAYNSASLNVLKNLGVSAQTVSFELTAELINSLKSQIPVGIFAYGRLPLMLTRNCPVKNGSGCKNCTGSIKDRMNINFKIMCDSGCSELLNSKPLWLADRLKEFKSADFLLLSFTDESKEEAKKIIGAYKKGGEPPKDYTRGLYYKGVL